ncbi:MAG: hypothetical protein ACJ8F7_16330 [Gemmataceae bacterium]
MSKIIVDSALRARLNGLTSGTEFCDPGGQPLGYFVTPEDYDELVYARLRANVTETELAELRKQTGGRSLKEIMADLPLTSP